MGPGHRTRGIARFVARIGNGYPPLAVPIEDPLSKDLWRVEPVGGVVVLNGLRINWDKRRGSRVGHITALAKAIEADGLKSYLI